MIPFVGVIKEVGPVSNDDVIDDSLGVANFQKLYFNFSLFVDKDMAFCSALGSRKIYSQLSWNPLKLYSMLSTLSARTAEKGIEGNYMGEGIILGGVLLIKDGREVVYQYNEVAGSRMPVEEIIQAIQTHHYS
jgi:hypothetical protein